MSKTAFIFAAFSLAVAAPAFAGSHHSGSVPVDIADAPNQPPLSLTTSNTIERFHSRIGMRTKLDQYATRQDCKKQLNLLTGREQIYCTIVKS